MESHDSSILKPTGIRPPSKLPAPATGLTRSLAEISASDNNARAMPPPSLIGTKHKTSALPEPAPKRKSLTERGGETNSKLAAPPSSRPVNGAVKATTAAGVRNGSLSSSVSTISTRSTTSTRNTSHVSSVGSRPASVSAMKRPHTSMSHSRSKSQTPRPATSMEPSDPPSMGKRKGTVPISLSTFDDTIKPIKNRAQRGRHDNQRNYISNWQNNHAALALNKPQFRSSDSESSRTVYRPLRDTSLSTAFEALSLAAPKSKLECEPIPEIPVPHPPTPSQIPRFKSQALLPLPELVPSTPTQTRKRAKSPLKEPTTPFLSKDSNLRAPFVAWDTKGRLEDMEALYGELKDQMQSTSTKSDSLREQIDVHKTRINELETIRAQLSTRNDALRAELEETRLKLSASDLALETTKRNAIFEVDDMRRKHRNDVEDIQDQHRKELDRVKRDAADESDKLRRELRDETDRLNRVHKEEKADVEKLLRSEIEQERQQLRKNLAELQTQTALARQNADVDIEKKEREAQEIRQQLDQVTADLERERILKKSLHDKLSEATSSVLTLESANTAMKAKIDFLQSDNKSQSEAFSNLQKRMQEAIDAAEEAKAKLRAEETLRRKLHNQVQELKGNIRVFCRVRPPLGEEANSAAEIAYPDADLDSKEVVIAGPEQKSAMGIVTKSSNPFSFDRVFGPSSQNAEVFEEISQLVQSALDGYNVCIFCYGQTGSGKTHTMSSLDGMIPRAVTQIYTTAQELEEKGWTYRMEGQFVEVYNENLNDLLGDANQFDKKKHEIRHDPAKKQTTITDITTVPLDSPDKVEQMLNSAAKNRSVAATMANSRSSRSHSVFILRLKGTNSITGERSEGTLNLVDLAGSERLSHSGATGDRLKETQNINRSLSCLGDVIGALGQGKEGGHVPYRNSKLTYLLQYSLGGNSKTLMFVMISPLQAHLQETLTSLKFATKVHNTHIGTAKRQAKVKE